MSEINSFNDYASRYNTNMDYSTLFGSGAPYMDSGMGGKKIFTNYKEGLVFLEKIG